MKSEIKLFVKVTIILYMNIKIMQSLEFQASQYNIKTVNNKKFKQRILMSIDNLKTNPIHNMMAPPCIDTNNQSLQIVNPELTLLDLLSSIDSYKQPRLPQPDIQMPNSQKYSTHFHDHKLAHQHYYEQEEEDSLIKASLLCSALQLEMQGLLEQLGRESEITEHIMQTITSNNQILGDYRRLYEREKLNLQQLEQKIQACHFKNQYKLIQIEQKVNTLIYPGSQDPASKSMNPSLNSNNWQQTSYKIEYSSKPSLNSYQSNKKNFFLENSSAHYDNKNKYQYCTKNTSNTYQSEASFKDKQNVSVSDWNHSICQGNGKRLSIDELIDQPETMEGTNNNLAFSELDEQMRVMNRSQSTIDSFQDLWKSIKPVSLKPNSKYYDSSDKKKGEPALKTMYKKIAPVSGWSNTQSPSSLLQKNRASIRRRLSQKPTFQLNQLKSKQTKGEDENKVSEQQRNTALYQNKTPSIDINSIKKNEGQNEMNKKYSQSNKLSNRRAIFQTQKQNHQHLNSRYETVRSGKNQGSKMEECRRVLAVRIDVRGMQAK